jgi:hypothetical protein
MKKLILSIIATTMLFGCASKTTTKKVESDPVTITMKVINSTDVDFSVNCSWCIDSKDQTTIVKAGGSYLLQSNTHDASGTVFTVHPKPPTTITQPDPSEGTFQMTYGYWNGAAHVTCNDICNNSNPTEKTHYTGCNWVFDAAFTGDKGINSVVTFTTKTFTE